MRVLVCGGRTFHDRSALYRVLDEHNAARSISLIISGLSRGADSLAVDWAIHRKIMFRGFSANWKKYGNAAGPIRNQYMLDEGMPDLVIAFPGGKGTADITRRAKARGVEVVEWTP